MKFYHYSATQRLSQVAETGQFLPRRRFVPASCASGLPDKAIEPVIFGLLDPLDKNWCSAQYHQGEPIFETIVGDISGEKITLLEINVKKSDEVYIADHAPHLRDDYNGNKSENREVVQQVKTAYWNSLIPLADYVSRDIQYALPEVICFSKLPVENLRAVKTLDKENLINDIRMRGGFSPHPCVPNPIEKNQQHFFWRFSGGNPFM